MAPCKSLPLSRHFISPLPLPLLPLSHLSSSNVGSGDLNLTNHLWGSLPLGKYPAQNTYSEAAGLSASFQINILNLYCLKWNNHIKYITPVLGLDSSIECFKSAEQRQKVNLKYFVIKNEILPSLSLSLSLYWSWSPCRVEGRVVFNCLLWLSQLYQDIQVSTWAKSETFLQIFKIQVKFVHIREP